jgi:cellulose synthase (UDP-forming)
MIQSRGPVKGRSLEPHLVWVSLLASIGALGILIWYIVNLSEVSVEQRAVYFALFILLFYCAIVYQVNRLGAAIRRPRDLPGQQQQIAPAFLAGDAPSVTILIPSYREEQRVLRMTLLSAVLARYGTRRAVVLLDDPPGSPSLAESQAVVEEVRDLVAEPMADLRRSAAEFFVAHSEGRAELAAERARLETAYRDAAEWLDRLADRLSAQIEPAFRHVDGFFVRNVVEALAAQYRREAAAVATQASDLDALAIGFEAISVLFCTEIECFERKRYANLSHAPNKAMNLNAYLSLLGGSYVADQRGAALVLRNAGEGESEGVLDVPASKYVLTLDADSVILPEYIATLAAIAEREPDAGVIQTPYHSFPDSPSVVERIAGATTDIQYLVHQGSSHFDAAYWVGANALLRLSALDRIKRESDEDGRIVDVFVQDKTLIEDTGSTVDLMEIGYRVRNHFAPLAYSSTPADFGSLAIQRQRWSNGGLIIFPQLLAQYAANPGRLRRSVELFLRSHYLLSPLAGNLAILLLMLVTLADARYLVLTPLAMLPYFILYGLDLKSKGYKLRDLFAVNALNLILLPVGLAGVIASIGQMLTGRKGAFWRTPKVAGRTRVAFPYIVANVALFALMGFYTVQGVADGEWVATLLPAGSLALYAYGLTVFIGWGNMLDDLGSWLGEATAPAVHVVRAPVRALGRLVAHPVTRLTGVLAALLVGIVPSTFGTAGGSQPNQVAIAELRLDSLAAQPNHLVTLMEGKR